MLWYIGVWALILAFLGPAMACCCQLSSKNNGDSGFACIFGLIAGSIAGYIGLLYLSSVAVVRINTINELIQSNWDSLELYNQINPCVDVYTRVDTESFGKQIDTLRDQFSKIHHLNWAFFVVTWFPIVIPFISYIALMLMMKTQNV